MRTERQLELLDRLLAVVTRGELEDGYRESRLEALRYSSAGRLDEEARVLFKTLPIIVGHESDLPDTGSFFTHDDTGVPILVTRSDGGHVHAMLNVCAHRGTRLVAAERGTTESFVCPYHAWTYDLQGTLAPVPMARSFPTLRREESGLMPLACGVRHGLVWVIPTPGGTLDLERWLGDYDDDLTSFGLASHVVFKRRITTRSANWKLVMDAFLESYHVKGLHPRTLAPLIREDVVTDTSGHHARSIGARRHLPEIANHGRERWKIREYASVIYLLFPNTVLLFHPEAVSLVTLFPQGPRGVRVSHTMLVAAEPRDDIERARHEQTWELIDGEAFSKEKLTIAESIQSVLHASEHVSFRLGTLEHLVRFFHDGTDRAIEEHDDRDVDTTHPRPR